MEEKEMKISMDIKRIIDETDAFIERCLAKIGLVSEKSFEEMKSILHGYVSASIREAYVVGQKEEATEVIERLNEISGKKEGLQKLIESKK